MFIPKTKQNKTKQKKPWINYHFKNCHVFLQHLNSSSGQLSAQICRTVSELHVTIFNETEPNIYLNARAFLLLLSLILLLKLLVLLLLILCCFVIFIIGVINNRGRR